MDKPEKTNKRWVSVADTTQELLGIVLDRQMDRSQQGIAEHREKMGLPPFRGGRK